MQLSSLLMGITTKKYLSNPSAKHECSLSGASTSVRFNRSPIPCFQLSWMPWSRILILLSIRVEDLLPHGWKGTLQAGNAAPELPSRSKGCGWHQEHPQLGSRLPPRPGCSRSLGEGFTPTSLSFFRKKVLPIIFLSLLGRSGDAFPAMSTYGRCRLFMETGTAGGGQHTLPRNSWIRSSLSGESRHLGGVRTTPPTVTAPALLPPSEPGTPPWNSPPASFQRISPRTFASKLPNQEMTSESFTKQR